MRQTTVGKTTKLLTVRETTRFLTSTLLLVLLPLLLTLCAAPSAGALQKGAASTAATDTTAADAAVKNKDEVVYARLSGSGEALSSYVVNHFTLARPGSFLDYGPYSSVLNQTDLQPLTLTGNQVTLQTAATNFFYQGYLTHQNLPWLYTIEYTLNKTPIQPGDLAGQSGHLEIRVSSVQNEQANETFYNNYMQQITLTLDTDRCTGITDVGGATAANSGKNRVLTFTVMPKHNADILVSAEVTDFEMAGIDIAAMPFSLNIDMPDTSGIMDDFSQLSQALTRLNDGVAKLKNGAADLKSGSQQLQDGSASFGDGFSRLNTASAQLQEASAQIKDALTQISSYLSGADLSDLTSSLGGLSGLAALPDGLTQLSEGLTHIADSLTSLKSAYQQAYASLAQAIENLPDTLLDTQIYNELYAHADPEGQAELDKLMATYTSAQALKTTYSETRATLSSVSGALQSLIDSLNGASATLSHLSQLIGSVLSGTDMAASFTQLTENLSSLAANYTLFHDGLTAYTEGVNTLTANYANINDGVTGINSGINAMHGGIVELHDGTKKLAEETRNLPDQVEEELDRLTEEYTGSDFEAVSFAANRKDPRISFVQFVFKTDGIERPDTGDSAPAVKEQQSFWDRFMKLFRQ